MRSHIIKEQALRVDRLNLHLTSPSYAPSLEHCENENPGLMGLTMVYSAVQVICLLLKVEPKTKSLTYCFGINKFKLLMTN